MRTVLVNLALVVVSVAVCFVAFEVLLRIVPNRYAIWHEYYAGNDTTVRYQRDARIGRTLAPNQKAFEEGLCYTIDPVSTNSLGFRDDEPPADGKVAIAVLGDSFLEARMVGDDDHASAILQDLLGVPVLSTALSGAQTVMELMAYEEVARPYRPAVVVLYLFTGNDIDRNLCGFGGAEKAECGEIANGSVTFRRSERSFLPRPALERPPVPFGTRVKDILRSTFVAYLPLYDLKQFTLGLFGQRGSEWVDLYRPELGGRWNDAWQVTEAALRALQAAVQADGAELVVAIIPEHLTISRSWAREVSFETGRLNTATLDRFYPNRRVETLARDNGIRVLNLLPPFLEYRDRHQLGFPYFAYGCDGHWNALGHYLGALLVARYLLEERLLALEPAKRAALTRRIDALLARSPREVLGEAGYQEIFGGGRFHGATNIHRLITADH